MLNHCILLVYFIVSTVIVNQLNFFTVFFFKNGKHFHLIHKKVQAIPEGKKAIHFSQLVCLLIACEGDKRTLSGAVVEGAPQTSCKERKTLQQKFDHNTNKNIFLHTNICEHTCVLYSTTVTLKHTHRPLSHHSTRGKHIHALKCAATDKHTHLSAI